MRSAAMRIADETTQSRTMKTYQSTFQTGTGDVSTNKYLQSQLNVFQNNKNEPWAFAKVKLAATANV